MKLTHLQREILNHRLEVPDAIHDALDSEEQIDRDDVAACCQMLEDGRFEEALGRWPKLAPAVLADAVEGSTYWACAEQERSRLQLANVERSGSALAKSIGNLIGRELEWPTW